MGENTAQWPQVHRCLSSVGRDTQRRASCFDVDEQYAIIDSSSSRIKNKNKRMEELMEEEEQKEDDERGQLEELRVHGQLHRAVYTKYRAGAPCVRDSRNGAHARCERRACLLVRACPLSAARDCMSRERWTVSWW